MSCHRVHTYIRKHKYTNTRAHTPPTSFHTHSYSDTFWIFINFYPHWINIKYFVIYIKYSKAYAFAAHKALLSHSHTHTLNSLQSVDTFFVLMYINRSADIDLFSSVVQTRFFSQSLSIFHFIHSLPFFSLCFLYVTLIFCGGIWTKKIQLNQIEWDLLRYFIVFHTQTQTTHSRNQIFSPFFCWFAEIHLYLQS